MPNPCKEVPPDRSAALDALTAESERMGMYAPDHIGGVNEMVRETANAICRAHNVNPGQFTPAGNGERYGDLFVNDARAALESLGVDLAVLAALRAGEWQAVPKLLTKDMREATRNFVCVNKYAWEYALSAAPKTPEAAR